MLSIVVPYYKLTFFELTLQSFAKQTDKRFKVYIGDDASPEDCTEVLNSFRHSFDFEYHRFEMNVGGDSLVKQWERCLDLVKDEGWVMILGDDDVLGENVVASFYENLTVISANIDVIRFSTCKIDERGTLISAVIKNPRTENAIDFLFRNSRSSLSEYVFKRNKIKLIGFKDFPLAWFSDLLAVIEFSNFSTIFSINNAIVYIRISNLSISGNQNNSVAKIRATFEFYFYLLSKKRNCFNSLQYKSLLSKLTKSYLNDKKNIKNFTRVSSVFITNFYFVDYCLFLSSIFKSILKSKRR